MTEYRPSDIISFKAYYIIGNKYALSERIRSFSGGTNVPVAAIRAHLNSIAAVLYREPSPTTDTCIAG